MGMHIPIEPGRLHTTALGAERIKKNLALGVGGAEAIAAWCRGLATSPDAVFTRRGKNWYVSAGGCTLTVNAASHTIITAHRGEGIPC